jgi:histidinol-phosphate/aromatic aminotransferase/cobyric acid decarboxylase-like protein
MSLRLHGDTVAQIGMLDFALNIWPEQRPAGLQQVLEEALGESRYPDESRAREAVAARHGRSVDHVLLLNGACEAFWLLAQATRPKLAACIHPSFTEAEAALQAAGSEVVQVLRDPEHWTLDPGDVPEQADLVVLGNPNNPTGSLEPIASILALARRGRLVVVDEAFMDFVASEKHSLARVDDAPGLVVLRSLGKLWSLAGIRAGYLLGPAALVADLAAQRQPWSVNALACAAIVFCASDFKTPARVSSEVGRLRAELEHELASLPGTKVWPGAANFLLLQVGDGPGLIEQLRQAGIAVRPAASFPGLDESYIRIAVRGQADNTRLLQAIREAR